MIPEVPSTLNKKPAGDRYELKLLHKLFKNLYGVYFSVSV